MANKAISELPQAQNVNNQDLFVLEQSGIAKKLTAETFITEQGIIDALAEALDGHGGIQSVTLSSVSGRIRTYLITFTDETTTTFQVLDGTSIDRIVKTSTAGLTDTYTVFMTDGTTTFFTVTNGADGTVSEAMLNDALKDKAPAITETTESSAIANFPDGADDMVMHNIVAEIAPVQSGSGDPAPDNIRPISGWTGVNVTRTGKNLCSVNTISGIGWATDNASLLAAINSLPAGTYNMSFKSTLTSLDSSSYETAQWLTGFIFTNPNGQFSNQTSTSSSHPVGSTQTANKALTITPSQAGKYTHAYVYGAGNNGSGKIGTATLSEIQFELGSSKTDYEPYQGTFLAIDWTTEAGTVYGGTIDVATGLLTVNRACVTLEGKTSISIFNVTTDGIVPCYLNPTNFTGSGSADYGFPSPKLNQRVVLCNWLKYGTDIKTALASNMTTWSNTFYRYEFAVPISDAVAGDAGSTHKTAVIDYLNQNPLQLCYELATSQTYQLTGQQLATFLGTNNVWADTGNVSVTYPADTKMFIEKLTQPTEDDMTANQAITSGKFFMVGNNLYIATAAIASGAKIIEGTNATRLSLADALNRLK